MSEAVVPASAAVHAARRGWRADLPAILGRVKKV